MKQIIYLVFVFSICFFSNAQNLSIPSFGSTNTFEIITWNIEQFPKNNTTTQNYVSQIIEDLDADIIAFQEINNATAFIQMMENLPQYQYHINTLDNRGLAYAYKTSTIQVNSIYEIFTTSQFSSSFPRRPIVLDVNFMGDNYIIINNHFKCCGDGILFLANSNDEETRRFNAANFLKQYIDTNLSNKRVIVLGDLNDEIAEPIANNVFQNILADTSNYTFADMSIAQGPDSNWSFPSFPSHLDHILITNEIFPYFNNVGSLTTTLKIENSLSNGWFEYDNNVSDHRPVAIKLVPTSQLSTPENILNEVAFSVIPNPSSGSATFYFEPFNQDKTIEIYNFTGQLIEKIDVNQNTTEYNWVNHQLSNGLYFVKLTSNNKIESTQKIFILK